MSNTATIFAKLKTALREARDCFVFYITIMRRTVELNHYPLARILMGVSQGPTPVGVVLPNLRRDEYSKKNNLSQGEVIFDASRRHVVHWLTPNYLQYSTIDNVVKHSNVITIPAHETREVVDFIINDFGKHPPVLTIRAEKNARVTYVLAVFGNREITKDVTLDLQEGAEGRIVGLIIGSGKAHFTLKTTLRHSAPRTIGDIKVKMVLKDTAYVSYDGLIKIDKSAQQTNSYLDARALILDRGAKCDGKPELEIEADDVKASHAFSSGKIDPEQIFYLRSRGLSKTESERLIVEGFLMEAAKDLSKETQEKIKSEIEVLITKDW